MSTNEIRFDDGSAYERYMGYWSQLTGEIFLDWLAPTPGLRWLDVGCGNGAFTELIVERYAPELVHGIDPAEAQLTFARGRPASSFAEFSLGDAMALPFPDGTFDVAVMPLVIFFVPEPIKGVEEMRRVTCPGGAVTAYAWDMLGGGFPYDALHTEMQEMGIAVPTPPSPDASRLGKMQELWAKAGLEAIETREIVVRRTFTGFDDYWSTVLGGPSVAGKLAAMTADEIMRLKSALHARLSATAKGHINHSARANAVKGRVPG